MIKKKYLSCIQSHVYGTFNIEEGTCGEITKISDKFVTILVNESFIYKIPHPFRLQKWAINVKTCLYYEYSIDNSYIIKYESLSKRNRGVIDQMYFRLVRSDIEDSVFIEKIKAHIDELSMDQALS